MNIWDINVFFNLVVVLFQNHYIFSSHSSENQDKNTVRKKKLQNVMRRMLFDFTYLSCSPLKKKLKKPPEIFRSSSNSPLIIITDVLFWKLVWTKKQELIELWAKINSLRCILTKKSNRKIRQQHCILSPPLQNNKKIQSFSLIFYSCR